VRPATVCGYSPRQRLDVIVNILTNHAINTGKIKVFGGSQMRPNIHIQDMVDAYLLLLNAPRKVVSGQIYNVGLENYTVFELAKIVQNTIRQGTVDLLTVPTDDLRSYHISSKKIARELGFQPKHSIESAVMDLENAFTNGLLPEPMTNPLYFNVKRMQELHLQ
jgi:nucleoside-diphosphate-sugar epimerase